MTDPATVLRRTYEVVNARDLHALDDLYHPELTVNGTPGVNREQIKAACAVFLDAFPDLRLRVDALTAGGDTAAAPTAGRWRGSPPRAGR